MNRQRAAQWLLIGLGILFVLLAAAAFLVARSPRFHRFVIAEIEKRASDATGGRVTLSNLSIHWRSLSADAYGLRVDSADKRTKKPLLSVDHLFMDVRIVSLLRRKVDLNEIVVNHPVVNFVAYADGTNNIPKPKKASQESNTSIFDLGIKHVLLTGGEVYYQQRKQNLTADLRNLQMNVSYRTLGDQYDGALSYEQGEVHFGAPRPITHSLQASFTFDRNQAELKSATLTVGQSHVWLNARLENYSNPRLSGSYKLVTNPQEFRDILKNPNLPTGDITLAGNLNYDASEQRPFMKSVELSGTMYSHELAIQSPQARTTAQEVKGSYQLREARLSASLNAKALAGRVEATLDAQDIDTAGPAFVKAAFTGVSISAVQSSLHTPVQHGAVITGKFDAYGEASWKGSISTLSASADLALKAAISRGRPEPGQIVPLNGALHVKYDGSSQVIRVLDTILRAPQTSVTIDGQISRHSNLKIAARTTDVRELNTLADSLSSKSSTQKGSKNYDVSGPATLNASFRGDMKAPQIAGVINAHDFTVQGDRWKQLDIAFQANPSSIQVNRGSLALEESGRANFTLQVALKNWSYSAERPIAANLQVARMSISSLQHIAGLNYPATGMLAATLTFNGSQLDPKGTGKISLSQVKAYDQPIQDVNLKFRAANRTIHSDLEVRTAAGNLQGTISFRPDNKAYEAHISVPSIVLGKIDGVRAKNVPVSGVLTLKADGNGTLDDPQMRASVDIPKLQVRDTVVQAIHSNLNVGNHRADFDVNSDFVNSYIRGHGTVQLAGDYPADVALDTPSIPIETLMALYKPLPNRDFRGEIELHATARGPLKDKTRMEAHLEIPTLRASYQEIQIANVQPIRADYQAGTIHLQKSEIKGSGTDLRFEGSIPITARENASLNLGGTVDMQIIRMFSPDIQSRGTILLDLRANRNASNLGLGGQIRLNKISLATLSSPLAIQNLNGVLDVRDNQVQITSLEGQTGGGTISAGGGITYGPQLAMNVSLEAKGVRLRYPDGVRAVIDSNLSLTGDEASSSLSGRVLLSSLGFTNDFDLAKFAGQFSGQPTTAPPNGFAQNLKLNVALQSTSQLQLVSSEVSLEGQVNLRIQGTAADPVIVGRSTLSNGDVFFMSRRYRLERGIIDFVNPNETQPNLNVLITTTINQYDLSVTLMGPVDRLRTTYVSDPPLPPVDIINLIARGSTTEETTNTNFDANSVLAQGLASQFSSRVQKFAGISSLSIDPLLGGGNDNPGARIALQQRVTRNFVFTFSTDVTNAQSEVIQGEYQLNPRWSVSAQRDEFGGYAFDAKYRKTF